MEGTNSSDTARQEDAFVSLLNQYEKLVFSICLRMTQNYFDAQDLTQETFLALYKALPQVPIENPGGFVTRIATNKCLDFLKRADRRSIAAGEEVFEAWEDPNAAPDRLLLEQELTQELAAACASLKPPYRETAAAYYCQDKTAAQIAKEQGKKLKTVQTQLRRAKGMLKEKLQKQWKGEDASCT